MISLVVAELWVRFRFTWNVNNHCPYFHVSSFKKHCYTDHSVGDAPPSRGVEMCVGRVAGVLEDGGGVDVEVLAAEHQAGPAPALLRRLGNLHLALAWITHYSSL